MVLLPGVEAASNSLLSFTKLCTKPRPCKRLRLGVRSFCGGGRRKAGDAFLDAEAIADAGLDAAEGGKDASAFACQYTIEVGRVQNYSGAGGREATTLWCVDACFRWAFLNFM